MTYTPTLTLVPSFTPTATKPAPTVTNTPTPTATQPPTLTYTPTLTLVPSFTPTATKPAPTVTNTPTPTATAPNVQPISLSAVCGYAGDYLNFWQVVNPASVTVAFTWDSPSTGERGSGLVGPNTTAYFSTNASSKVVRLFVNNQLVSQAVADDAPCRVLLNPAFGCTPDNQIAWLLFNDNEVDAGFSWSLDGQQSGSGVIPARSSQIITFSPPGDHTFVVAWEFSPLGPRSVTVTTTMNSCAFTATRTPTPPAPEIVPTFTLVPSFTPTQSLPGTAPTGTPTPGSTPTADLLAPGAAATFTLVPTLPQPGATETPVLIPVTGVDLTPTGRLAVLSRVFINLGMVILGVALLIMAGLFRPRR